MDANSSSLSTGASLTLVRDFELRFDDTVVQVPPTAQRLLCFLALQDHPVRRAYVSGCLWPEANDQRAVACLRSALWRVPSPGGLPVVRASSTHLRLDKSVQVDLPILIEQSALMFSSVAPVDSGAVSRILWLYGQDLLDGWYDEWAISERERFRQLRLHVLEHVGETLFVTGRHREALDVALAVVAAEPLRESIHRLILRVHLYEGNIAEAIRQYRWYADHLEREIGASPSPAIDEMIAPYLLFGRTVQQGLTRAV